MIYLEWRLIKQWRRVYGHLMYLQNVFQIFIRSLSWKLYTVLNTITSTGFEPHKWLSKCSRFFRTSSMVIHLTSFLLYTFTLHITLIISIFQSFTFSYVPVKKTGSRCSAPFPVWTSVHLCCYNVNMIRVNQLWIFMPFLWRSWQTVFLQSTSMPF